MGLSKELRTTHLTRNSTGATVVELQKHLDSMGFLPAAERHDIAPVTYGVFDGVTAHAVEQYQRFFRLSRTGEFDEATRHLMARPRCGVRDINPPRSFFAAPWPKLNFSFSVAGPPSNQRGLDTIANCVNAFGAAFSIWSTSGVAFQFHPAGGATDIAVSFGVTQCGGEGCTDCPPPNHASVHMMFDDSEDWTPQSPTPDGFLDMIAFGCHEAGHALGICDHSDDPADIMYPYIASGHRALGAGDVQRIRQLFASALNVS